MSPKRMLTYILFAQVYNFFLKILEKKNLFDQILGLTGSCIKWVLTGKF